MRFFGFNKKSKPELLFITENDRDWVESSFDWLIKNFGYPSNKFKHILLNSEFFPHTFVHDSAVDVNALIKDLCILFNLSPSINIRHEVVKDIRDSVNMPYEIRGVIFEARLEIIDDGYNLLFSNSLLQNREKLIYFFTYEFIKIKLAEEKVEYDTGEDTDFFLYLAGVYWGFGVLLSHNLLSYGGATDLFWEQRWTHFSGLPGEVMAFALAAFDKIIDQDNSDLITQLPLGLQELFKKATHLLNAYPTPLFNRAELDAINIFNTATEQAESFEWRSAIELFLKIPFLTTDNMLLLATYNNIGYYKSRLGLYKESIEFFRKAISIEPKYGYANDNMGYSYLQMGYLEEGKAWIDKAILTNNNDHAYSCRNLGLFFLKKQEYELSEKYFLQAFNSLKIPVDLLEYHYAELLLSTDRKSEASLYLKKSIEKGEIEATKLLDSL